MRAVDRQRLDGLLVERAVAAGARFEPGTKATVLAKDSAEGDTAYRHVRLLTDGADPFVVAARVVLVADGLGRSSLDRLPEYEIQVDPRSRLGLGATLPSDAWPDTPRAITMVVGRNGYVGMVRTRMNWNVAAAVDRSALKSVGPREAIGRILSGAGIRPQPAREAEWAGTRPLTTFARRVAGPRLFLLGDGTGYTEPFTGEGIAWALESAVAAVPFAAQALRSWDGSLAAVWQERVHREIQFRRRWCRAVARLTRFPRLAKATVMLLRVCPNLIDPMIEQINRPESISEETAWRT
jgi:flavin-dependent dehydrogenase